MGFGIIKAFCDVAQPIEWRDVALGSLIGALLGVLASYVYTYKLICTVGRRIRATTRFGDIDVWEYFHNSPDTAWVVVRDHRVGLMYFGRITHYSDSEKARELLMEEVDVYTNDTAQLLYSVPTIYLERAGEDLTIEVATLGAYNKQSEGTQEKDSDDEGQHEQENAG